VESETVVDVADVDDVDEDLDDASFSS